MPQNALSNTPDFGITIKFSQSKNLDRCRATLKGTFKLVVYGLP